MRVCNETDINDTAGWMNLHMNEWSFQKHSGLPKTDSWEYHFVIYILRNLSSDFQILGKPILGMLDTKFLIHCQNILVTSIYSQCLLWIALQRSLSPWLTVFWETSFLTKNLSEAPRLVKFKSYFTQNAGSRYLHVHKMTIFSIVQYLKYFFFPGYPK